jgi:hypothetical protein
MANDKPLKDQNRGALLRVIIANAVGFYLLLQAKPLELEGFAALTRHWTLLLSASGAFVITSVLCELLDATTKGRLVFWRWRGPLPGSRAFSDLIHADPRVDVVALTRKLGQLPVSPREQNAVWYRLYLKHQNDPQIVQVHRTFLFDRDYAALAALGLCVCVPLALWLMRPWPLAAGYGAVLILQYLFVRQAAKHQGVRLVTSVLALEAASDATAANAASE